MGKYDYLDDLPPSGEEEGLGTAAWEDVGTEDKQLPFTEDVKDMISASGVSDVGILTLRFITSSQNITLKDDTTSVFAIIIGAGGGGGYGTWPGAVGGGAGGVSIIHTSSVVGGAVMSVAIGAGGAGSTNEDSNGDGGSSSIFAGFESEGGAGGGNIADYTSSTPDGYGGEGSADLSGGVLWSKRGGTGMLGEYTYGQGGNPWGEGLAPRSNTVTDTITTIVGDFTATTFYDSMFPLTSDVEPVVSLAGWGVLARGIMARNGYGGASGCCYQGSCDGENGGDGIVILMELS